jgi:hypothetical protein
MLQVQVLLTPVAEDRTLAGVHSAGDPRPPPSETPAPTQQSVKGTARRCTLWALPDASDSFPARS